MTSKNAGAVTSHFPAHFKIGVLAVTNLQPSTSTNFFYLWSNAFCQCMLRKIQYYVCL